MAEKQPRNSRAHAADHLVKWKPGQSGNPAGRPPLNKSLAQEIRDVADEIDPEEGESRLKAAIRSLWIRAKREGGTFDTLTNRGWGKVPIDMDVNTTSVSPEEAEAIRALRWAQAENTVKAALKDEDE